jgi:hypothetical protein
MMAPAPLASMNDFVSEPLGNTNMNGTKALPDEAMKTIAFQKGIIPDMALSLAKENTGSPFSKLNMVIEQTSMNDFGVSDPLGNKNMNGTKALPDEAMKMIAFQKGIIHDMFQSSCC